MENKGNVSMLKHKLHFEIPINADIHKVYSTMIDEQGYRDWTAVFNPTSRFEGSWEKGSKIRFIGADENGKEGGMVSRIRENNPDQFVSIEHLGVFQDGEEIMTGPEVDSWAGGLEDYSFREVGGKTIVSVDVDTTEEFKPYMEETYPKALEKLKEICEK